MQPGRAPASSTSCPGTCSRTLCNLNDTKCKALCKPGSRGELAGELLERADGQRRRLSAIEVLAQPDVHPVADLREVHAHVRLEIARHDARRDPQERADG